MLHDRIGEADCTLAFEKVCDFNDDDALIVGWQRWTQDLICMRSRLSNAMIELNKRQAEDIAVQESLAEALTARCADLCGGAPAMVQKWLTMAGPKTFDESMETLGEILNAVESRQVLDLADKTPVDLDQLTVIAKSGAARKLYAGYKLLEGLLRSSNKWPGIMIVMLSCRQVCG